ncbi:hypothetical protein KSF_101760 [Reticulibacter mediterranei]|uniref:Uncharacterized protein n=1 Tax=Reticulibacter mediterranei TaxID=2778369 RepID=A0A8J3ITB8_9CHLR|nr:hypothetical protein KSF_101760 [Reticulibacter mediterranei]
MIGLCEGCYETAFHRNDLTRPEIAHDVIETTKALANLLGISIDEQEGKSED